MPSPLPPPIDGTQQYLAAIHDRLGELLDRLPAKPAPEQAGGTVELREPAALSREVKAGEASSAPGDFDGVGAPPRRRPTRPASGGAKTTRKRTPKKEG